MSSKCILDTHALIWYLEGNPRLSHRAKKTLSQADCEMVLSVIALAEAAYLIEKSRIAIPSISDLLTDIKEDDRIEIYPLTMEIFERSLSSDTLRIPELHDRFIVSTGLYLQDIGHSVSIVSKDQTITDVGILPVIW